MGKLSKTQIQELIENYPKENLGGRELGERYGVTRGAITTLLKRHGVKIKDSQSRRKWAVNDNYFNIIDTEEKAYILGFFYADAYNRADQNHVTMFLQEGDKDILEKISEAVSQIRPLVYSVKKGKNNQNQWGIVISSRQICQDLIKWGCPQAKTLIIEWPEFLHPKLFRHFLRGMWDGDGHVGNGPAFVVSTKNFCIELQKLIKRIFNFGGCVYQNRTDTNNDITHCYSINGKNQLRVFLDWLYKDSTIYLDRKYNKYLEIVEKIIKNPTYKLVNDEGSVFTPEQKQERERKQVRLKDLFLKADKVLNGGPGRDRSKG